MKQLTDPQNLIPSEKQAEALAIEHFGLSAAARKLPGELDFNYRLTAADGSEFTLKIAHLGESRDHLDMQNAIMQHFEKNGTDLHLPRLVLSKKNEAITLIRDASGNERFLRLLTWVPGRVFANVNPHTPELLESLGETSGKLCRTLQNLDHPGAHRWIKWDVAQTGWVAPHLTKIEGSERQALARYFFDLFQKNVAPQLSSLRRSLIYNDANDYNVLVDNDLQIPKVKGVIDFGDAVHTITVADLAIAIAYAVLDKPRPLDAAVHLVRGFHREYPLLEEEVAVLYPLVAARLLISVTVSAINRHEHPENEYLLISERPAWDLLEKWRGVPPALAHYRFRHACGWEPCPQRDVFEKWMGENGGVFGQAVDFKNEKIQPLDLSVASLDLGNNSNFSTIKNFEKTIARMLEDAGASFGIGGYGEVRPFYTTDAYQVAGNSGPLWRTVHLGTDIWAAAGTPVFAPLDGTVHSFQDNAGDCNYGPTIILEHKISDELTFFTLYGHLSRTSLPGLSAGMPVKKGQQIATIGPPPENGNWPPHLHFQVMLNMLGFEGDFPGVAFPEEREVWLSLCPQGITPPAPPQGGLESAGPQELGIDAEFSDSSSAPPPLRGGKGGDSTEADYADILASRRHHLGRSLSISYKKPLHMVRGYMQYLYDTTGRRYLDTVNNVPHAGHQHSRVVRAAQRQMAVLNTNTRYLHENIVRFAEELLATFPPELSVVHFVNSGSEANELALRMVRAYTGQRDMIAVEVGYHGNTGGCIDISSYKFDGKGGKGAPPHTHIVPMPDTYRGLYRNDPAAGKKYADHVRLAVEKIQSLNRNTGGFICESILSCGGQIVLPEGYLHEAYRHVRAAGGLCIADEVQVGFGRVGEKFWGFELQGVVPDIVTMGKPIGNGHPLAAVVTTPAVAEAFANGMEYFNTFGGNPVSCAIGREVLKIVQEEGLQAHALRTGKYLTAGLRDLQQRHPIIGDVRGPGLFLGFELVKNPETLEPATHGASYLANRMREHGVLMSTDGPFENVLKIKPPMCFDERNADFLIEMLDKVLKEDFLRLIS
jgi:4-aminobutyrate aminotransferase-like enzyme/Ser/Thr protein kinase RdoA (MazF antagonist)/murein DD-endopeptidase MepM/ murein hydrolase activator NlpD